MGIHFRYTRMLALVGVLALGGASAVRAQQPTNAPTKDTSAMRPDTSGYKGYQKDSLSNKAGAADTVLKSDQVVCKDGSNAPSGQNACSAHGGVDSVATAAAKKARGVKDKVDTATGK